MFCNLQVDQLLVAYTEDTKVAVFWDVAPCSLVEVYRRVRGAYCLLHQGARQDL
jgi:hypothetical protein